ncbi:hypothetical protein TNCV_915591 [Trichonephila clavipes]|nr:hypothetical protein TNCV_915591 [Trichonephila clavipes]
MTSEELKAVDIGPCDNIAGAYINGSGRRVVPADQIVSHSTNLFLLNGCMRDQIISDRGCCRSSAGQQQCQTEDLVNLSKRRPPVIVVLVGRRGITSTRGDDRPPVEGVARARYKSLDDSNPQPIAETSRNWLDTLSLIRKQSIGRHDVC